MAAEARHTTPSDYFIADLSSRAQVRRLAEKVTATYPHLDILIKNAGTYQPVRHIIEDGMELTFAVNYLALSLLTYLLRGSLVEAAPSRVVNVASTAHSDIAQVRWDNLQEEEEYDPWNAYALSKFAMVTFTYRLAEILQKDQVTANCLHPGVVNTKDSPCCISRHARDISQGGGEDLGMSRHLA
jgi:NAD(P)-dependent dehydrogenase (short-subunit alcohol dehydrogenase family)